MRFVLSLVLALVATAALACQPKQTAVSTSNATVSAFAQAGVAPVQVVQQPVVIQQPAVIQAPTPSDVQAPLVPAQAFGLQAAPLVQSYATQYVPRTETVMVPQTVVRYDAVSVPLATQQIVTQQLVAPTVLATTSQSASVQTAGCRRGGLIANLRADAALRHAERAAKKAARLAAKAGKTSSVAFAATSN